MAVADYVPVNEILGVFLGIAGYDWLSEGRADALEAAAISLTAGVIIGTLRYRRSKRRER